MIRGTHRLQKVNFKSPIIAIMSNKKEEIRREDKKPKTRMRKKRYGIFTKKVEV